MKKAGRHALAGLEILACVDFDLAAAGLTFNEACDLEAAADDVLARVPRIYDEGRIAELVERAAQERAAWAALVGLAGLAVTWGDPVPGPMREWTKAALAGKSPPRRHGPSPWRNLGRNVKIIRAIEVCGPPVSAAFERVADQFGMTPRAVAAVWAAYRRRRPVS